MNNIDEDYSKCILNICSFQIIFNAQHICDNRAMSRLNNVCQSLFLRNHTHTIAFVKPLATRHTPKHIRSSVKCTPLFSIPN